MKLPQWMPSNDFIAQAAHFGWGCLIVLVWALFAGSLYGALAVLGYAAVKEFAFDKYIERQPFTDNLIDFLFWFAGAATGVILLLLRLAAILR